jgi:hypothetical protein
MPPISEGSKLEKKVTEIALQRTLRVPPDPAYQALNEVLDGIAAQKGAWRGFALHVGLADLHLPDVGYVAVPIRLRATKNERQLRHLDVTFSAASYPAAFPTFKGSIGIDADGPSESILSLKGGYDAPLSLVGRFLDSTLIAGVAARTLENFVDELAAACTARVDQREEDFVRLHYYNV